MLPAEIVLKIWNYSTSVSIYNFSYTCKTYSSIRKDFEKEIFREISHPKHIFLRGVEADFAYALEHNLVYSLKSILERCHIGLLLVRVTFWRKLVVESGNSKLYAYLSSFDREVDNSCVNIAISRGDRIFINYYLNFILKSKWRRIVYRTFFVIRRYINKWV